MARITAPMKLNGWALGAHFTEGVAESDHPAVLAVFGNLPDYKIKTDKTADLSLKKDEPDEGGNDA